MLKSCLTASELKCLCVGVRWGPFCLYLRLLGFKHHLCIISRAVMKATLHKTLEDERAHGGRDTVDDQSTFLHRTKSLAEETDMLWFSFYFSSAPRYSGPWIYLSISQRFHCSGAGVQGLRAVLMKSGRAEQQQGVTSGAVSSARGDGETLHSSLLKFLFKHVEPDCTSAAPARHARSAATTGAQQDIFSTPVKLHSWANIYTSNTFRE